MFDSAHRETVLGSTRNSEATSPGVISSSSSIVLGMFLTVHAASDVRNELDVSIVCATVIGVIGLPEEKKSYYWIVIFREGDKLYTYYRTMAEMAERIGDSYARTKQWPWRMWVIADGVCMTVEIK